MLININVVVWIQVKKENCSLPVVVRGSKIESFRFEGEDEDQDESEDQGQLLLTVRMLKSVTVMA